MSNNQWTIEHSGIGLLPTNRYFSLLIIKIVGFKNFFQKHQIKSTGNIKPNKDISKIISVPIRTCSKQNIDRSLRQNCDRQAEFRKQVN